MEIFIIGLALFFSVNMGASNFGVTFAAACGSKAITPKRAQALFALCVVAGALCLGREVTSTLEGGIIPAFIITPKVCIIILFSAVLSIFISNILQVPQSTSLVTVAALMGVGLYFHQVMWKNILWMLPFWIFLPVAGYFLTYFIGKMIYPPRKVNFWIYEKLVNHKSRLKAFVIFSSCYNAFSVGTNNVANVVGPLVGSEMIAPVIGLLVMAPFFGVGSVLFPGALKTSSERKLFPWAFCLPVLYALFAERWSLLLPFAVSLNHLLWLKWLRFLPLRALKTKVVMAIPSKSLYPKK